MITITVSHTKERPKFVRPIDCWGAPKGTVYQQYVSGRPVNDYLIGAGSYERPISIWYSDDSLDPDGPSYLISSESKKDLRGFLSHVSYKLLPDAKVTIKLEV